MTTAYSFPKATRGIYFTSNQKYIVSLKGKGEPGPG